MKEYITSNINTFLMDKDRMNLFIHNLLKLTSNKDNLSYSLIKEEVSLYFENILKDNKFKNINYNYCDVHIGEEILLSMNVFVKNLKDKSILTNKYFIKAYIESVYLLIQETTFLSKIKEGSNVIEVIDYNVYFSTLVNKFLINLSLSNEYDNIDYIYNIYYNECFKAALIHDNIDIIKMTYNQLESYVLRKNKNKNTIDDENALFGDNELSFSYLRFLLKNKDKIDTNEYLLYFYNINNNNKLEAVDTINDSLDSILQIIYMQKLIMEKELSKNNKYSYNKEKDLIYALFKKLSGHLYVFELNNIYYIYDTKRKIKSNLDLSKNYKENPLIIKSKVDKLEDKDEAILTLLNKYYNSQIIFKDISEELKQIVTDIDFIELMLYNNNIDVLVLHQDMITNFLKYEELLKLYVNKQNLRGKIEDCYLFSFIINDIEAIKDIIIT